MDQKGAVEPVQSNPDVEHPRGLYSARLDEKGRLKLPADFHKYLTDLGSVKVFVTTFDERIGRIYPLPLWKQTETGLGQRGKLGKVMLFTANDFGGDAELDGQGRMLIPAELRKALKVENEQVRLQYEKGAIHFYGNTVYEEQRQAALATRAEALAIFEDEGLL